MGLSLTRRGGSAAFSPASLFTGQAGAWYDPSDISTLFQDSAGTTPVTASGDPVGKMLDKSGNGFHLTQATAGNRPTYTVSGALKFLLFDGTDDRLDSAAGFTATQPWERLSAIRQVSWTDNDWLYGAIGGLFGILYQVSASPNLRLFDGATGTETTGLAVGSDGVVEERHNGASSRIRVNKGSFATGDGGSSNSTGGFRIGNGNSGGYANFRMYGFVQRDGTFSATEIDNLTTYLGAKAGLTL